MKVRAGSGWQTVLADLSLILFMVTASAVGQGMAHDAPPPALPQVAEPLRGDPVAVWRPGPGGPALAEWLAQQGSDERQRLSIVVPYAPGGQAAALELARDWTRGLANPARVIVEPGDPAAAYAALTFDMAQPLQDAGQRP